MITRLGRIKMTEESAPAAEQTVWTMLFSRIEEQSARMVQSASVDGEPLDGLQPGIDAGMVKEEIAQLLADRFGHQAEIGNIGDAGFAQIQLGHAGGIAVLVQNKEMVQGMLD